MNRIKELKESVMQPSVQQYKSLMITIRHRLDAIEMLRSASFDAFSKAETAAFHGRKAVEGIAFGCLVAVKNGLRHLPRDAKGQWNAEKIFRNLMSKNINVFPSPSVIRTASESERVELNVRTIVEGIPGRRLTHDYLIAIYTRLHKWLHEINPYIEENRSKFIAQNEKALWEDLSKVHLLVERHFISIGGEGFFCTLRDSQDGRTKVLPLSRTEK